MTALLVLLAAASGLWALILVRRMRRTWRERGAFLEAGAGLLTDPVHGRDASGYGTLKGGFHGAPAVVTLIPEAVAFRRLPQLWLSVSIHRPTGAGAVLDIVRRATNVEFYAPASDLPARYAPHPSWPADTLIRGSDGAQALLARAGLPVARILADSRVKEVLIAPRGVRIVVQACEGERGAYLLTRESRFALTAVDPAMLGATLAQAHALAHALTHALAPQDCRRETRHEDAQPVPA